MKSPAKGALAMVFAGAITFSVANGMLKATKLFSEEHSSVLSGIQQKSEVNRQIDEKSEANILAVQENAKQKTVTEDAPDFEESLKKEKNTDKMIVAVHTNTEKSNRKPAVNPVSKAVSVSNEKPSAPEPASAPAGSKTTTEASKPETSTQDPNTPASGTGGGSIINPAAKTLNHGQQVSQAAKEKAESNRVSKGKEDKENNGKNH
ncbi:hypothetical protein [Cytobacillus oceanisediminis]|uniref:Uncharacterized protein n=1 Tax=Cytobacillus oceanisediminis TaxID=665099 RepID=A0ABX3D114_9BACI|nr:hypothetical protein [Cytobacillus oceanisediminis]OHX50833.1 hypothetical protein BBV17_07405 [Cytobacillus oceanisediminis]USK42466.1 hypothetical protein LIT27_17715 [Cytobacillus oceanisediminis]